MKSTFKVFAALAAFALPAGAAGLVHAQDDAAPAMLEDTGLRDQQPEPVTSNRRADRPRVQDVIQDRRERRGNPDGGGGGRRERGGDGGGTDNGGGGNGGSGDRGGGRRGGDGSGGNADRPAPPVIATPTPQPPQDRERRGGRDRTDRGGGDNVGGENRRGENRGGENRGGGRRGGGDGGWNRPDRPTPPVVTTPAPQPPVQDRDRRGGRDRYNPGGDGAGTRDWNRDRDGRDRDRDGRNRDRDGRDWNNGGQNRDNGGWNRDRNGGGRDWNDGRADRRDYGGYRDRRNQNGGGRDWNRGRSNDWWRNDRAFRNYSGVRFGFYFAPNYGYYSVPRNYINQRWSVGDFLPSIFWRYRLDDYRTYGLGYPPEGTQWVAVDNTVYLIDRYDGYIIDVVYDAWRW